ncbi:uncharacterized protein LOC109724178 [Ananas comosus]|uniref:Uncharacterized protein LOC109724178 n=1 Tax=Ananas comosus TaxID=4615 RepID=A0A6P5GL24_ANACO|nr:uncharacterized protein LOC109724178 [Ananas comosus]
MIVQVLDPWAIHGQLVIYASGEDMESELLLFSVLELGETFWLVVAVVYLFILSERQSPKEIVLHNEENSELGVLQFYDEVNFSRYDEHIEAGCFLLKRGQGMGEEWVGEDGERITYAGKLEWLGCCGVLDEDAVSLKTDLLAGGVWNEYFGRCSKWTYMRGISEMDSDLKEI